MAQTAHHRPPSLRNSLRTVFNTDGHDHPVENTLAVVTLALGAVAALTAISPGLHVISSWVGLAGVATGGWGQLVSATTAQRFALVLGMGAAAMGLYLGIAHGGLVG